MKKFLIKLLLVGIGISLIPGAMHQEEMLVLIVLLIIFGYFSFYCFKIAWMIGREKK